MFFSCADIEYATVGCRHTTDSDPWSAFCHSNLPSDKKGTEREREREMEEREKLRYVLTMYINFPGTDDAGLGHSHQIKREQREKER